MRPRYQMLVTVAIIGVLTAAGQSVSAQTENVPIIRPAPNADWQARLPDVEKVLRSAAGELWVFFPGRTLEPILVEPRGGPIVLFKRGTKGEYRVRLNTGNTYWAQYAFQFAHEFCHILCEYRNADRRNKWFEESLCETASLFALRRMAKRWATDPPYPNWKDYAPALRKYADQRLGECRLPTDMTLAEYYTLHADRLSDNPVLRDKTRVIAGVLLTLFEEHPEHWEAVSWLNRGPADQTRTFDEYLGQWCDNSPEKHRPFVRRIAGLFGVRLSPESTP